MNKKYFVLLMVLGIITYASSSFAITVWFNPSPSTIQVGYDFDLALVADIGNGTWEPVTQFKLDILFDTALMSLNSITGGSMWPVVDLVDGHIVDGGVGPFMIAISGEDVVLATLHFSCLAPGASEINLNGALDADLHGFQYFHPFDQAPQYWNWTYTPGIINQTETAPVPEPATMLLLGIGLIRLAGFSRKFKK